MRTLRECRRALLPALFAVAGCGGGVGHIGSSGTDGGPGGNVIVGDDGGITYIDAALDDVAVPPGCASGAPIGTGEPCGVEGMMCPLGTLKDCDGTLRTLECFCDGREWSCDPVTPMRCPPPAACPDPSTLMPGTACDLPAAVQCISTDVFIVDCAGQTTLTKAACHCDGSAWSCPAPPIPTCAPMPCPDPSLVYSGGSCSSTGTCAGNPTYCGGELYYDALECLSGQWVTLATTACDIGGEEAIYANDADFADVSYVDASTGTTDGN